MGDQSTEWGKIDIQKLVDKATRLEKIPTLYKQATEEVNRCDKQIMDILHYLELIKDLSDDEILNQGYKLIDIRRRRRKAKDFIKITEELVQLIQDNQRFFNLLNNVKGKIKTIKDLASKRSYVPRVETNMESAFKKLVG